MTASLRLREMVSRRRDEHRVAESGCDYAADVFELLSCLVE